MSGPAKRSRWLAYLRPFAIAVGAFLVINLLLQGRVASLSPEEVIAKDGMSTPMARTFTGWTARAWVEQKTAPDIVLFGSSQMGTAVFCSDAQLLQKPLDSVYHRTASTLEHDLEQRLHTPVKVFNWALGGSMVSDAYIESLALLHGRLKPKMVIIGVNPRDFVDNSMKCPGATEEFRYFSQFVDPGDLLTAALPDPVDRLEWLINNKLALRRLGMNLQHLFASKSQSPQTSQHNSGRAAVLQSVSNAGADVDPGTWVIPPNMPLIFEDNTKEYLHRYANPNPPSYPAEMLFFRHLIALLKSSGIQTVVVGMPSMWPNRKLLPDSFWSDWRGKIGTICSANDVPFVDLTDSPKFIGCDYLDTVHMNATGGARFFNIVSDYLASQPRLAACLRDQKQAARSQVARTSSDL